jgi:hypothetical protein
MDAFLRGAAGTIYSMNGQRRFATPLAAWRARVQFFDGRWRPLLPLAARPAAAVVFGMEHTEILFGLLRDRVLRRELSDVVELCSAGKTALVVDARQFSRRLAWPLIAPGAVLSKTKLL